MRHQSPPHFRYRSLRPALLAALFLWIALAGLRPALAACADPTVVTTEAQLNNAINAFNAQPGPCAYEIEFGGDITLTGDLTNIGNANADVSLLIDGAGFTLDGNEFSTIDINDTPEVTIDHITILDSEGDGIGADNTNLRVSRATIVGSDSDAVQTFQGSLVIIDSTLANSDDDGLDAFSATTPLDVINSTIFGNDGYALLIEDSSNATLTHLTVAGNFGGLDLEDSNVTINNSIFADNTTNCVQENSTVDFNYSLLNSTDDACGAMHGVDGNRLGADPQLLPPGNYGGPTQTMPPLSFTGSVTAPSPVVDAGDDALSVDETNAALPFDQRGAGYPRVDNGEADMGAVEKPQVIVCPAFPITANDEEVWRGAITCYNAITTPGVYTINLGADIDLTAATPTIDNNEAGVSLVVEGNGRTLDGQDSLGVRPLTVAEDAIVTVNDATLTGGNMTGEGGGVQNEGNLTLNRVTVTGNRIDGNGGGIFNEDGGTLAFNDGEISDNLAAFPDGDGGGVSNDGQMTISRSAVINNTADGESVVLGGGILTEAIMTIVDSTIAGNTATGVGSAVLGGGINNQATLLILNSTISGNDAAGESEVQGGGIHSETDLEEAVDAGYGASLTIINSTISGNSATAASDVAGGGLYVQDYNATCCFDTPIYIRLTNTTLSDNSVTATDTNNAGGGGAYFRSWEPGQNTLSVLIENSILANSTTDGAPGGDCLSGNVPVFESFNSLYEDSGVDACGLAAANPDANGNIIGVDPALGPLADNGGPTLTHLPGPASEAIDSGENDRAIDQNAQELETDQRGYAPRIVNGTVDMGAVEVGAEPPAGPVDIFLSANANGVTGDGLPFGQEDVLRYDGAAWSLYFDCSAHGLMPNNAKHNLNAIWIPDPDGEELVLSFGQNRRHVPNIDQPVDGMDLVWWNGTVFAFWFDGSDVDLTNMTQEKIDALHVLPGSASPINGGNCLAYLLVSTQGPGKVKGHNNQQIKFSGEDVLGFCATGLGATTTGKWHLVLDGSAQGMPKNSTTSISVSDDLSTLYLTTKVPFNVDAANGGHSMVFVYDFGSQSFSGPLFVAADNGFPRQVDGLHVGNLAP